MKRCFIENENEFFIHDWLWNDLRRRCSYCKIDFDKDIEIKVFSAAYCVDEVKAAVKECEEIYVYTQYVGESGYLFDSLMQWVIAEKLPSKTLINLAYGKHFDEGRVNIKLIEKAEELGHKFLCSDDFLDKEQP